MKSVMEGSNFTVTYLGELRTEMTHLKSGSIVRTDAPVDNNGKGSLFSPTDLVASALSSCMLTVIGIYFQARDRELGTISCEVKKVMSANPRRISEIHIDFDFGSNSFSEEEKIIVRKLAISCPVANSLSGDLQIVTNL